MPERGIFRVGNCNTIYCVQVVRQLQGYDLYEYGYAASGIQKYYNLNKLNFQIGMRAVDKKLNITFDVALIGAANC